MAERSFDIYVGATFAKGLKESLEKVVDDYEEQREDWFVDKFSSEPAWQDVKDMRDAAKAAAQVFIWSSGELASTKAVASANKFLQQLSAISAQGRNALGLLSLIREEVELDCFKYAIESVDGSVGRFWKLVQVAEAMEPTPRTAAFLRSVSRCYLAGFDSECIVMCRSVLDAAFDAEIPRDECGDDYSLASKMDVACRSRRISYEAATAAHRVRERGNDAVHFQPAACEDALPVIKEALAVLRELCH